jgi:glycosyltransferase involved in cell wall biosynthesis
MPTDAGCVGGSVSKLSVTMSNEVMSQIIRLLYITAVPRTQVSFLRGQNGFMAERGFELHSICTPGPGLEELHKRDGVEVHPISITRLITPFRDLLSLFRVYWTLRRVKPTIIHVSTPKAALMGALAATAAGVPIRLFLVRGLATENTRGMKRRLFRVAERLTAALCHRTVFVSKSLQKFAWKEGIVPFGEGAIAANGMSNGVNTSHFCPDSVKERRRQGAGGETEECPLQVLGFVGRLCRDKGIEDLVVAWDELREEFPQLRLLLVGDWEAERPVSSKVRQRLENDPKVCLAGQVADVRGDLKSMTVFAYPSYREGFPNAPMEAAAMGLPVVATQVAGCVDAVQDGVTGTLVPPRDPEALAAAIRRYLNDPALRRQHGMAGRERVVRDFRPEIVWEAMYQEYVRLLEERGLPVPVQDSSMADSNRRAA